MEQGEALRMLRGVLFFFFFHGEEARGVVPPSPSSPPLLLSHSVWGREKLWCIGEERPGGCQAGRRVERARARESLTRFFCCCVVVVVAVASPKKTSRHLLLHHLHHPRLSEQ